MTETVPSTIFGTHSREAADDSVATDVDLQHAPPAEVGDPDRPEGVGDAVRHEWARRTEQAIDDVLVRTDAPAART